MTGEAKQEVERFLRSGDRPGAIRYLNDAFKISLNDADVLVSALEREIGMSSHPVSDPSAPTFATTLDGPLKAEVEQLLLTGRKGDAAFNLTGCLQMIAKGIGIFLMVCALMFMAAAAIIYFVQEQSISNSDEVTGVVTAMRTMDNHGTAPVIEYEWRGKKQMYESRNYASPPDYEVGQSLSLFIHREEPEEVTIDSFADRYALIVGLAVPGAVLLLVSVVFLHFGRRKF